MKTEVKKLSLEQMKDLISNYCQFTYKTRACKNSGFSITTLKNGLKRTNREELSDAELIVVEALAALCLERKANVESKVTAK